MEIIEDDPKSPESEWVISIKEKLMQVHRDELEMSWAKLSIYKFPHYLRDGDEKAYVPQIVSLGPYHHGKQGLRQMDRHKWRSLHRILERTNHDIKLYLDSIGEVEKKIRCCYEGPISFSRNEFVEMMVLDGCFVLELFQGAEKGFDRLGYPLNDPIFAMCGSMHSIKRDMIMLENQLPLFVLDRLLGLQHGHPEPSGIVVKLALRFFDPLTPNNSNDLKSVFNKLESSPSYTTISFDWLSDHADLHCLNVFRRRLLQSSPELVQHVGMRWRLNRNRVTDRQRQKLIPCARELKDAGIKFQNRKSHGIWNIKFENGVLQIPRLLIDDATRSVFLNMIAFEQCHLVGKDITLYVVFMNNLINSHKDVAYLHDCGVINHHFSSDAEVAELFDSMCQEVVYDIDGMYLPKLSADVNAYFNRHYKPRWNEWMETLRDNYFSNPWTIISLVAAVVLLLLTFTQTFYAVYGYHEPN